MFKTRIAPTPTGYLHLGNVLCFALTAALAKKHGASILLRIDDLDHQRVNKAYAQDIFDTLQFLGIPWHEGPRNIQELEQTWSQKHRTHLYSLALQQLKDAGLVFGCNCSRTASYPGTCLHKGLPFEGNAWRIDTTGAAKQSIKQLNGGFELAMLPEEMHYFVVSKKDGYPAYQLASVVDDLFFGVDFVVRGQDLWPSTVAQHFLADKLNEPLFNAITFYHHPLLTGPDGKKLSKSAGSTSVQYLRKQGKTPTEIYAMVGQMAGMGNISNWEDIAEPPLI